MNEDGFPKASCGIDSNKTTVRVNISTLHRHRLTNSSEYEKDSHALILFDEVRGGLPEHATKHAYSLRAVIVRGGIPTVYTRSFEQDQAGACLAAKKLHERLLKRCERQVEGYGLSLENEEWFITPSLSFAPVQPPKPEPVVTKPQVRTSTEGRRAVFMDDARITEWTAGDPLTAPLVPWLAKILDDAAGYSDPDRDVRDVVPSHEMPTTKHGTIPPKGGQ